MLPRSATRCRNTTLATRGQETLTCHQHTVVAACLQRCSCHVRVWAPSPLSSSRPASAASVAAAGFLIPRSWPNYSEWALPSMCSRAQVHRKGPRLCRPAGCCGGASPPP
ncbi:hypothetical protein NDU88_006637 [Pleurodeles waltl]|uniref:Uncharacterized protein n=1 Tax=Pleurodeles waltl TaxID=8319 RepID=A0AAV7X1V6_PLEWA|nr:hypothetical protein NDU88_006637 [Pleurodeles waltl]